MYTSIVVIIVLKTGPASRTGWTGNRWGNWSGLVIGSAMLMNRWEPAKTIINWRPGGSFKSVGSMF